MTGPDGDLAPLFALGISRSGRPRPLALLAGGFALVVPVLVLRGVAGEYWTPQYTLLGVESAIGLPVVLALLRTTARRAAACALAFAAWALVSMAFSPDPSLAFWGFWLW